MHEPTLILAHGIGGRSDLPVPLWAALYAGALAVLISFFGVAALWSKPRLNTEKGLGLPAVTRIVDSPAVRAGLRGVGLVCWGATLLVALLGPTLPNSNPAGTWFYVWFWVGLVLVSMVVGPIYRLVNPLRTVALLIGRLIPARGTGAQLDWLGYWPAIAGLLAFVLLELVIQPRSMLVVFWFVAIYSALVVAAGVYFGPRWFARGDGFEVYLELVARIAPIGRGAARELVLRNPLRALSQASLERGLTAVIVTLLGSTAFDGLSRMQFWTDWDNAAKGHSQSASYALGVAGVLGAIAIIGGLYAGAVALTRPYLRLEVDGQRVEPFAAFANALIPIMIGYTIAHYFSFFVFQGQAGYTTILGGQINYSAVSTTTIAVVQVLAIIGGHVVAVVSAHDRALEVLRPKYKQVGQYPILALMVCYTVTGIELVAGGRQMLNAEFFGLTLGRYADAFSLIIPAVLAGALIAVSIASRPAPLKPTSKERVD